jgi:hypothetical protein
MSPTTSTGSCAARARPHVGDVGGAQVDLGRRAGALADHDVVAGAQVGQALQRDLEQRGLVLPVAHRRHVGPGPAEHDDLRGLVAAGLEQHGVHRRLGRHARGGGLDGLRTADLGAVGGDGAVEAHVLRLERRDLTPSRASQRHSPAVTTDLPASDVVPRRATRRPSRLGLEGGVQCGSNDSEHRAIVGGACPGPL